MMRMAMAWTGLLILSLGTPAFAGEASVEGVLACMKQAVPEDVVIQQDLRLETVREAGAESEILTARLHTRVSQAESDAIRRLQAVMHVQAPDYLAGAAYLLREGQELGDDGMYVFLPSVGRVRQVSGGFANTALMGTEFSYNDFRRWQGLFGDVEAVYVELGERQGRAVHRLRLSDAKPRRSGHDRVDVAVDAEHCLVVQADLYDGDALRKRMQVDAADLRQFGHYWYPMAVRMEDVDSGARTDLRVERIRAQQNVPEGLFDPSRFHRIN